MRAEWKQSGHRKLHSGRRARHARPSALRKPNRRGETAKGIPRHAARTLVDGQSGALAGTGRGGDGVIIAESRGGRGAGNIGGCSRGRLPLNRSQVDVLRPKRVGPVNTFGSSWGCWKSRPVWFQSTPVAWGLSSSLMSASNASLLSFGGHHDQTGWCGHPAAPCCVCP